MKRLALVIATAALALGATGCQNWTGGKANCCKSKSCNKNSRCCRSNKMCGKRNCRGGSCCSHNH